MSKLKVGIVGLGHMGLLHMMNCFHIDGVKVEAVADGSKLALKRAKSFGVENVFTDYHDMIKGSNSLDSVIISLPNFLHFESARLALEEGLNVFIEKPMANSIEECQEISNYVKKSGRKLMVGHCMRFVKAIKKIKEAIEEGYIGDLEVVTAEMVINGPFSHPAVPKPVPEWWFDPSKVGGGVLHDLGYHLIDLYRFLAGDSKVIFSSLDHRLNLPVEDKAIVILRSTNSNTEGIINAGWYQKTVFPKYNFRTIVHGNAGYISSDELIPRNPYVHAAREGFKNVLRRFGGRKIKPLSYSYYYESYYEELDTFFKCLRNDSELPVSEKDGMEVVKLIDEAYRFSN